MAPLVRARGAVGDSLAGDRPLGREDRTVLGTVSTFILSAAVIAAPIVSKSLISPTRIMSGSCLKTLFMDSANEKESVIFETCKVGTQQQKQVFFISVTLKIHFAVADPVALMNLNLNKLSFILSQTVQKCLFASSFIT